MLFLCFIHILFLIYDWIIKYTESGNGWFPIWILSTSKVILMCDSFFLCLWKLASYIEELGHENPHIHHKCKNERIKAMTKTNAVSKAKGLWVLIDCPVAKSASHELANEASWIAPWSCPESDPDPDPDPDPPIVVPVVIGEESLEDFRLQSKRKIQYQRSLIRKRKKIKTFNLM